LTQLAAISTFLHNIYNGLENILKRIALFRGVTLSRSSTWHKDLLLSSHKQGIFSEKSLNDLMNLLSFRHFFVHSYVFNVTWIDLKPLAQSIDKVVHRFKKEIFRFLAL
ncbi:MAG TPA: hypothetical protein DF383_09620, partial [Deltaproteobacteria bacterium]|nr:hypothetical protein [Deltaproteobacteria bacterium]